MKLRDMPTDELRRALEATERAAGFDSHSANALRRELARRRKKGPRRRALSTALAKGAARAK